MKKILTEQKLKKLIKEAIEDELALNSMHFDKNDFPEFFEEFIGTLGNDFDGYDYPSSPEEESNRFDIFMRNNHPDATPSAQAQVGYDDADSVDEIGDGPESSMDDLLDNGEGYMPIGFVVNEARLRKITERVVNRVTRNMFLENKKPAKKHNIANLYPGTVTKKVKKNGRK